MDTNDPYSRIFDNTSSFEIQKYYQNKPRFIWVYFRDNLHDKTKDGTYAINLDEYSDILTHWFCFVYIEW